VVIRRLTEEELARQLIGHGAHVRTFRGRWWRRHRGWWEPVHRLALLRRTEIRLPGPAWGYRASLAEADAGIANATFPVHLMSDLTAHDPASLPRDSRRAVRRAERQGVRIVRLTDIRLLAEQGHQLVLDWHRRVGPRTAAPTLEGFLAEEGRHLADDWLVLGAIEGDRLLGYSTAWAVDDIAYLHEVKVATAEVRRGITAALNVAELDVLRRTGGIRRVTIGLHEPEKPSLTLYKTRNGFPVVQVPSRAWMALPAEILMRARRPLAYYRMTGRHLKQAMRGVRIDEPA
jgi:hypothetical protein